LLRRQVSSATITVLSEDLSLLAYLGVDPEANSLGVASMPVDLLGVSRPLEAACSLMLLPCP
jgi:hypothetical protein